MTTTATLDEAMLGVTPDPRARRAARALAIGTIAWGTACTATRLDVIAEDGLSDGSIAGGSTAGRFGTGNEYGLASGGSAATVEEPTPFPAKIDLPGCVTGDPPTPYGSYHLRLRSTQGCLAAGAHTTLAEEEDLDAYLLVVGPCLTSGTQSWSIRPFMSQYSYQLRNASTNYNLDVKFAGETPETEVILYQATPNPNQLYSFRLRTNGTYEVAPDNASTLCVTLVMTPAGEKVQTMPCDSTNEAQGWEFIPDSCG